MYHPKWTPVIISRGRDPIGMGSIFTGNDQHRRILTAKHIFSHSHTAILSWKEVNKENPTAGNITAIEPLIGLETCDVAMCHTSNELATVSGVAGAEMPGARTDQPDDRYEGKEGPIIRSLVSGEQVQCVGLVHRGGDEYVIATLESEFGQSGTGFVDPKDPAMLYVLKGPVLRARKVNQLCGWDPDRFEYLSLLCPLRITLKK